MSDYIELLETIHSLKSVSEDAQTALALATSRAEDGIVKIRVEAVAALQSIMAIQNRIITGLTEENQTIMDHVETLIKRLENS